MDWVAGPAASSAGGGRLRLGIPPIITSGAGARRMPRSTVLGAMALRSGRLPYCPEETRDMTLSLHQTAQGGQQCAFTQVLIGQLVRHFGSRKTASFSGCPLAAARR